MKRLQGEAGMANNNLVNSLLKGLDILTLVGRSENGMRLSGIAELMGLKVPAVHNLIRTLLERGFLEKRNGNLLYIGPVLMDIAGIQQDSSIAKAAEKVLQSLHETLPRGVVVFGVATPREIRQIFRISYDRPRVLQRFSGDCFHLYSSAAGLLGLAFANEVSRLLLEERHPFAEFGLHLWRDRAHLECFLEDVRSSKVAICPFDSDMFFRVSVPVFDSAKRLLAVIGASISADKVSTQKDKNTVIKKLKEAAAQLGGERR